MASEKKLPHLPELDGLRGLAALAVFFHHFFQYWNPAETLRFPHFIGWIAAVSGYGYLGVDVFFGLSGFLITSLLLIDRENTNYFHNFYWKRVLRILPVYLVHLIFAAVMLPGSAGYILLSAVFLVNFAGLFRVRVMGPTWTLSIEEQFYLIWPQLVRRLRLRSLYYTAFVLIVFSMTARMAIPMVRGSVNLYYTFYRCDGLALGAVLALQWYSQEGRSRMVRGILKVLNSNVTLVCVVAALVALLASVKKPELHAAATLTLANCLVYRLIGLVLKHRGRGGRLLGWLGSPIAVYLGAISYALYMYQSFIFILFAMHGTHVQPTDVWGMARLFAMTLGTCLAVCTVSRYAMELPVQRLRRFVLRPSRPLAMQ